MTEWEGHVIHYNRYICVTLPASPVFRVEVSPSESAEQTNQIQRMTSAWPRLQTADTSCDQPVLERNWAQKLV